MKTIISVENLRKNYGHFQAIQGVSFEIHEGEIFGLLGPNGAGKTTTISILSTLLEPSAGNCTIGGKNLKDKQAIRQFIGIVPQELALYPSLSARDNLSFFGKLFSLRGKDLSFRIADVLKMVGLSDRAGEDVETYSGGMKRRLNLAAGLIHDPRILFLDEPTVGVDPQSRNHIFENIQRLKREGLTIIYTTHYMEEAQLLCDRVGIMDQGQIIAIDTPQNLIQRYGQGLIHLECIELSKDVLRGVGDLPHVEKATFTEGKLAMKVSNTQIALLDVLKLFNTAGITITALNILEPNLENVFLKLTGKRLRDVS